MRPQRIHRALLLTVCLLGAASLALLCCDRPLSNQIPTQPPILTHTAGDHGPSPGVTSAPADRAPAGRTASAAAVGGWRSLDDLARGRIAVFTGTAQDFYATRAFPRAEVQRLNSQADFVLALKTGKVDVAITDTVGIRVIARDNPDLAILAEGFYGTPIGAAFRKGDEGLRGRFDRFLAAVRADGTLDAIGRRWLIGDPASAVMPAIPVAATGEPLRVGTSLLVGLPFVALADGQFIGYDMELIRRFAARDGFRLEILPLEFDSLVAALAVGKIEMVVANLSITEERRGKVDFSAPYDEEQSAALVLKANLADPVSAAGEAGQGAGSPGLLAGVKASLYANLVLEQRWRLIAAGLGATLVITVASTLLGTLLGAAICALRMSRRALPRRLGATYIFLLRGLPVLLLLMLIYYVVFAAVDIDPLIVAVIAFGMNFAAYVSEMFRSGIEGVDPGQTEAGIAMGFTRLQTFRHIVLPQATRRILPVYRGEFISLVKMTSIVGYIGVQDLTKAGDIIRSRTFEAFFPLLMVAAIYFLIIWVLGMVLDHIDRRTDPKARRGARAAA